MRRSLMLITAMVFCKQISAQNFVDSTSSRSKSESVSGRDDKTFDLNTTFLARAKGRSFAAPGTTGAVGNGLTAPIYVNLYWDTSWDSDNPTMPQRVLDAFTAAILKSSYFAGLSEYGVGAPSFGGGFLPQWNWCPQKAPTRVGFYDPFNASIVGFLQCELQHGGIPQGPQVVYNIILPQGSLESDFFGNDTFCGGGPALAWHFHGTPYSPEAAAVIGATLLGASTAGTVGALAALVGTMAVLKEGPIYTIESADPMCGTLTNNLLHEMVEAASDPFPAPNVILTGSGEIADLCAGMPASQPFVPPSSVKVLPAQASSFPSGNFTTGATISVPQYWSNKAQQCVTGFSNKTRPSGPAGSTNLKVTTTGNGASLVLTIAGQGFGTFPGSGSPPSSENVPYIAVQDDSQHWQAGNLLNTDSIALNIASWNDTNISVNGFDFFDGNLIIKPGDSLSLWVCNGASGLCGATSIPSLSESGSAQTRVSVFDAQNVNLLFNVKIDGNMVASNVMNGGGTSWLTYPSGTHVISEAPTTTAFVTALFRGACDKNGNETLNLGDNQACSIINVPGSGCPSGQHCCSTPTTTSGCISGCIPNTIACRPLCPPGYKCCGAALPTGRCDDVCIKSPPAVCP